MTERELIALARQAHMETSTTTREFYLDPWADRLLRRFGVLVAQAEREACARACADAAKEHDLLTAHRCAELILERGDQ